MRSMKKVFVTVPQASLLLGVPERTLRRWVSSGKAKVLGFKVFWCNNSNKDKPSPRYMLEALAPSYSSFGDSRVLSTSEAATVLGVSQRTVQRMATRNELKSFTDGHKLLVVV